VGWSGGGPHVSACAAPAGHAVSRRRSPVPVCAPHCAEGLDWLSRHGARERSEEFRGGVAGEWPPDLPCLSAQVTLALAEVRSDQIAAALGGLVSDGTARALNLPSSPITWRRSSALPRVHRHHTAGCARRLSVPIRRSTGLSTLGARRKPRPPGPRFLARCPGPMVSCYAPWPLAGDRLIVPRRTSSARVIGR